MLHYTAFSRFVVGVVLTLISTTAAICAAGSAGAAPEDQDFLNRLDEVGITYTSPYGTTFYARGVCRELDLNVPHAQVVNFVQQDNPAFAWENAADYVVIAYMTYCPWNRTA